MLVSSHNELTETRTVLILVTRPGQCRCGRAPAVVDHEPPQAPALHCLHDGIRGQSTGQSLAPKIIGTRRVYGEFCSDLLIVKYTWVYASYYASSNSIN
jgi:hypothetical protein